MSVLSAATRSQRGTLGDLVVMWVALFGAFAYLDVPMLNAPVFAMALVLQAALGTFVITRLLDGLSPSLLLLCGPGLILGGALSFAVYQLTGRGAVGAVTTALVGVVAAIILSKRDNQSDDSPRIWIVSQLFGLAATAMMVEFSELLPLAILFFVIGFAMSPERAKSRWVLVLSATLVMITITTTSAIRQDYWWLVTDDYQFFEVMARHITVSGPLADWGVTSFLRYHWLSYGWSGLLDLMGGSPAPFVTMTRVMPLVYSVALASSLTLIRRLWIGRDPMMRDLTSVWVVVAIAKLDWSGTNTAGVYAVLSALSFLLFHMVSHKKLTLRGLLILGAFGLIVILTKVPSVFAILTLGLAISATQIAPRSGRQVARLTVLIVSFSITALIVGSLIWLAGPSLGWRLEISAVNPNLGQVSELDKFFALTSQALSRLPLLLLVGIAATNICDKPTPTTERCRPDRSMFALFFLLGLALETSTFGVSSNHFDYLSGPMYFLASFSIITLGARNPPDSNSTKAFRNPEVSWAVVIGLGLLWTNWLGSTRVLDFIDERISVVSDVQVSVLRYVTSDGRFGACLGSILLAGILLVFRRKLVLDRLLLLPLVVLTFSGNASLSLADFRSEVSQVNLATYLGSSDIRSTADILRRISRESDLIGTNHLFSLEGKLMSDFSLAAWSKREFYILGPNFGGVVTGERAEAIENSMQFAESPNTETCRPLEVAGVKWFVVDLRLTETRDWSRCAVEYMSEGHYTLLKMRYS